MIARNIDGRINAKPLTKKAQQEFLRSLRSATGGQEALVEGAYHNALNRYFVDSNPAYARTIFKPLHTDGLLMVNDLLVSMSLITEFKDDIDLEKRTYQERILAQVIYYIKHIDTHIKNGNDLNLIRPNVVLAADANQVFVINARVLYRYLELDLDWEKPARLAYDQSQPKELFSALHSDKNVNPYIYDIRAKDFDLNDVFDLVNELASNENEEDIEKIPVLQANIRGVYDEFLRMVVTRSTKTNSNQDLVNMFIRALTDNENIMLKGNEARFINADNTVTTYKINGRAWYAFFSRFDTNYSVSEIKDITEVADVLLEETKRRFSGEYWTPTIWAKEAVSTISEVLGEDWRQKYNVWDASAGSKNLTRDFKFSKLYSSTLFDAELDMARMYNSKNYAFQYDFLNDDIDMTPNSIETKLSKKAPKLWQALVNDEPIVFYMNPPYATAGDLRLKDNKKKIGVSKTKTNQAMKEDGIGQASENLYSQFLWRVAKIKNDFNLSKVVIAFFTKSQYMAGGTYFGNLNERIFSNFDYKKGFLLNSGEFSDTSSNWGISFVVATSKKEDQCIPDNFILDVKETSSSGIKLIDQHIIRNMHKEEFLSEWVREALPNRREINWLEDGSYPTFSSPFVVKETSAHRPPKMPEAFLGYAWNKGNNVEKSFRETALFSATWRDGNGFPIVPENFERVMVNFAIRKATKHSWITDKDNYQRPNKDVVNTDKWRKLVADSVVYSLFNQYSYQVALRDVEYLGKSYNIENQFFFMSREEIIELSNKYKNTAIGFELDDVDDEMYVYKWLNQNIDYLSDEAQKVLNDARVIVEDTFEQRDRLAEDYPEFNFNTWNAGWEQIRRLMKNGTESTFYPRFKENYKTLENKINNNIYEFGFLDQ